MKTRKLIAILVTLVLMLGCFAPLSAMAADEEVTVTPGYSANVECQRDGQTLRGTLTMPDVYGDAKVPMVILSHGFMSSQGEMANLANSLAKAGYASVRFDFMGSGQSDGEFIDMTTWTEVEDLHAILDYVKTLAFVDQNNIFLSGNSFGGVVTALTAPDRAADINAICLWYPAMSMCDDARNGFVQTTPYDVNNLPDSLQVGRYTVGKEFLKVNLELYPQEIAVNYTDDVLILHGTADYLVPASYSVEMAELYESAELVLVEGGGHGFWGASFNSAAATMIEFLDAHVNSVSAGNTTAACGEGETATIDITYNGAVTGTTVSFKVDSEFDIIDTSSECDGLEFNAEEGLGIVYDLDGFKAGDVICSITFDLDVDPWVLNGDYKVDFEVIEATDDTDELFDIIGVQGYITIENDYLDGDIVTDGIVTNADVITLARYLINKEALNADQLMIADYDGNGKINNADLIKLARAILAA